MDDLSKWNAAAEQHLAAGRWEEGLPWLRKALDRHPGYMPALDNLGIAAATLPDRYAAELFKRIQAAVDHAGPQRRRELLWYQLCHGAYFNKIDLLQRLAAAPEALLPAPAAGAATDGEDRRAALGALLVELGQAAAGEGLLKGSPTPLGAYHLFRLAERQGDLGAARERLLAMPLSGAGGLLRQVGLATLALRAGSPQDEALRPARALFAARDKKDEQAATGTVSSAVASELLLLRLRVALAEQDRKAAEWAAQQLGMPPDHHDPSAMLRAMALLGPLYKLGQRPPDVTGPSH